MMLFLTLNGYSFPYTSNLFMQCPSLLLLSSCDLSTPPPRFHVAGDSLAHFNPSRRWCVGRLTRCLNSSQLLLLSGGGPHNPRARARAA